MVNPDTGVVTDTGAGTDGSGGMVAAADVTGTVVEVAPYRSTDSTGVLAPLVALEVIAVVALPPLAYFFWIRRRGTTP